MQRLLSRPWRVAAFLALLGASAAALFSFHFEPRHGADRVYHLIDWDDSCASVEMETARRAERGYAASWRSTLEVAHMQCTHLGDTAFYARFPNAATRRREVAASPPVYRICDAPGRVQWDDAVEGAAFRRRCARMDGRVLEGTYRYCVAGRELAVDGFIDKRDFRALCAKLDGRIRRAPRNAASG
jgi:hypothetical protein